MQRCGSNLFDQSGILVTGYTPQNGIIITVMANSNQRVDVTPSFRYSPNSYQAGAASFQLPNLAPGPHTIKVSAADNLASGINAANHRNTASIDFQVSAIPRSRCGMRSCSPTRRTRAGRGEGPVRHRSAGRFGQRAPCTSIRSPAAASGPSSPSAGIGQVQIPWDGSTRRETHWRPGFTSSVSRSTRGTPVATATPAHNRPPRASVVILGK
jgi:hypothetical protein